MDDAWLVGLLALSLSLSLRRSVALSLCLSLCSYMSVCVYIHMCIYTYIKVKQIKNESCTRMFTSYILSPASPRQAYIMSLVLLCFNTKTSIQYNTIPHANTNASTTTSTYIYTEQYSVVYCFAIQGKATQCTYTQTQTQTQY